MTIITGCLWERQKLTDILRNDLHLLTSLNVSVQVLQLEAKGEVFAPSFRECRDTSLCPDYYYFVLGWGHTTVKIFKNSGPTVTGNTAKRSVNWNSKQKLSTATFKSYIIRSGTDF